MIIKKFQGKTEAEATESAKKELGSHIVIMNVRNVKKKGLLGLFVPQQVEVTVALEEESERIANARREENLKTQSLVNAIAQNRDALRKGAENPASQQNAGKFFAQATDIQENDRAENRVIEEKLDNLHSLLEQQLQKPEEEKEEPDKEGPSEIEKFMKLLYNTMLENEIKEQYANQIIDEIEKLNKPDMPFDYALANIYQKMVLKFGIPSGITDAENGPKVIFFIGPTGVGKTTTIAKIASKFSVEAKKKIALLTADTYRIAAAEQLRTYANILEVPFRVIYSIEEMERALLDFREYDFILVDTAGHSYQNEEQREVMSRFVHSVDDLAEKEVFLVLSATTKCKDLLSIADTYTAITDYKLIFTKLDETTTLGNLLNVKLHTGAEMSYVTCGQNVPDDIEKFNPQKTVKQLLGGKKDK